jgi:hypothetical protein
MTTSSPTRVEPRPGFAYAEKFIADGNTLFFHRGQRASSFFCPLIHSGKTGF